MQVLALYEEDAAFGGMPSQHVDVTIIAGETLAEQGGDLEVRLRLPAEYPQCPRYLGVERVPPAVVRLADPGAHGGGASERLVEGAVTEVA